MCYKNIAIISNQLINFIKKNRAQLFKRKIKKYPQIIYNFKIIKEIMFYERFNFFQYIYEILENKKYYLSPDSVKTMQKEIINILEKSNLLVYNEKENRIPLLLYLSYTGNYETFSYIYDNCKKIIKTYSIYEIKQCFYIACYKNFTRIPKFLYKTYKNDLKLQSKLLKKLFLKLYDRKSILLFEWMAKSVDFNLSKVTVDTKFYNEDNVNKMNVDLFWISCKDARLKYSKIIYMNYQKHLHKQDNINIFLNLQHQSYFSILIYRSLKNEKLNKTIQWLFLISGFNLNYRGYLIDLIEYCCDINHFNLLDWLQQKVLKIYDLTKDPFFINDCILIDAVKQNHYKIVKFLILNKLLKIKDNEDYYKLIQKCIYLACKLNYIKIVRFFNKNYSLISESIINKINKESDDSDDTDINIFTMTHRKLYKITLEFTKLMVFEENTDVYKNLFEIYKIIYRFNSPKIFIEKKDRIFVMICKYNALSIATWFKKKFKFYDIFQNIKSVSDNYELSLLPCIDNNDLEYLLLNENWLKISEKFNMDIIVKKPTTKCNICFENNTNCQSLCEHSFCFNCIYEWLEKNNTCPYCREKINEISDLKLIL